MRTRIAYRLTHFSGLFGSLFLSLQVVSQPASETAQVLRTAIKLDPGLARRLTGAINEKNSTSYQAQNTSSKG